MSVFIRHTRFNVVDWDKMTSQKRHKLQVAIDLFSHKVECFNVDSSHSLLKVTDISWEKQPKYQLSFLAVYIKSAPQEKKSYWLLNCASDVIHHDPSACITPLSKTGCFTINILSAKKKKERKKERKQKTGNHQKYVQVWGYLSSGHFGMSCFLWILKCLKYSQVFLPPP